jgi:hypothetical protein
MSIQEALNDPAAKWTRKPPAPLAVVKQLVADSPVELPTDYISFLARTNGGCGGIACPADGFDLWPAEKVIENNDSYQTGEFIPGFLGFGSNGGGELFAFDARQGQPYPVVMIPFIPMQAANAKPVAPDFAGFVSLLGRVYHNA